MKSADLADSEDDQSPQVVMTRWLNGSNRGRRLSPNAHRYLELDSVPADIETIINCFPDAFLSIHSDGPPTYQGENPHRIIVTGTPDAFRMLAQLLNMMADTVAQKSEEHSLGWNLLIGPETIPQLQLDPGYLLSLACDPGAIPSE